ncbi:DUF4145 domain-containing protein [Sporosarcina sp. P33]|uniref:DUF4145 domain-containing protein n=1 Tax=Sporosarcina sp. P33 TaxID=1930764 RepID=UPI0009BD879C|nr:DUF4145 domain-containing protein [Sporosarcina sp. P33]ARD47105.1 hypothetical protein SporoP33_01835 [Sporosarcina sp. P33]
MSEKVILTCPHCGNTTPMDLLNKFEKVTTEEFYEGYEAQFNDIFEVFECPVCQGFHLFHTHWNTEEAYYEGFNIYEEGKLLYPYTERLNLYALPKNVRGAYESALRVQNIDEASCVITLRRTLEMVCKDKGATTGQLHQKLNHLQQTGVLPPLMGDISKVIKDIGNMAAHGDQVTFNKYMVESLFRFTNKILEYVYILPKEMKRIKFELEQMTAEETSEEAT